MKSTGIVRTIDELGRIVIPMEIRKTLNINNHDHLEIFTNGDEIIFRKWEISCVFCGSSDDLISFNEKKVCEKCAKQIKIE